ncbi:MULTISPECIES: hypothetical protein [Streptomyces]|uniref:Uncharacterized protein n=1 Tax=Streptomyces ramulosus TaxID=47762 RepID=A0ABW1FPY4_9ACTN
MSGSKDEREWRALLERAVPELPAPGDRLGQVRWRIRRRRRRRAAACAGALAVACGATVASLVRPPVAPDPPAAPAPAASHGNRTASYPGLLGLAVRLAPGWTSWSVTDPATGEALGFAATRPRAGEPTCAEDRPKGVPCAPAVDLGRGDALIVFRTGNVPDATDSPRLRRSKALGGLCRAVGATQQWDAGRPLPPGDGRAPVPVRASVCLREAPDGVRAAAEDIVGSAHLGGSGTAGPDAGR